MLGSFKGGGITFHSAFICVSICVYTYNLYINHDHHEEDDDDDGDDDDDDDDHHHHQWHHSAINEPWALLGFFFTLRRFSTNFFLHGEVVSLMPNFQPEVPGLHICTPRDRVAQLYPRTLGSSGILESPFPIPT
jgi:hypothetical protein